MRQSISEVSAFKIRSLWLQKPPSSNFGENGEDSPDISMGFFQLGMCEFDSPAPASHFGVRLISAANARTGQKSPFSGIRFGLRTPSSLSPRRKLPKVSGLARGNSRLVETIGGESVRSRPPPDGSSGDHVGVSQARRTHSLGAAIAGRFQNSTIDEEETARQNLWPSMSMTAAPEENQTQVRSGQQLLPKHQFEDNGLLLISRA
jgi:hypothetical protein